MEKTPVELQLDSLFGFVEGLHVAVRALLASQPDKDTLEGHFDMLAQESRAHVVADARSDFALTAFDDMLAVLKGEITGQPSGSTGLAHLEAAALRKRLTGK